ncbi:MAG: L-threonylcarbamoyladenylate synthase [Actinomycetota bacterium]|nr:L-threonylcarbamoyladenylate synthase [Actinomycetota bacterium]
MTALQPALDELAAGRLVVIPTDTVYGLAAACGAAPVLFELKGRPQFKPLPVLASSVADLQQVAIFSAAALRITERMWPGPLTLVLEREPSFGADLGGDGATVAVRVPAHGKALELLARSGPVAVTSANRTGEPPATTLAEARAEFGDEVRAYVEGGRCDGAPSSVVSLIDELRLLREGSVSLAEVRQALG